jgi:hypothetical protein
MLDQDLFASNYVVSTLLYLFHYDLICLLKNNVFWKVNSWKVDYFSIFDSVIENK